MDKFQELLEKYNITEEDIDFDYSEMSDEELEAKFAELFEETKIEDEPSEDDSNEEIDIDENFADDDPVDDPVDDPETSDDDDNDDEEEEVIDDDETPESKKIADEFVVSPESYAVVMTDGTVKEFAVSLQDQISALTMLVNETYGETDNCWYDVIVYDKNVVMSDWWTGRAFRQDYKVRSGVYSLVGDRVPVHSIYVTDDEEKALDELKANFASASAELDKYRAAEEKAKKQDLMSSDDYKSIFDKDEFKDIDIDKFSLDELTAHLDEVLLKYAKEGNLNFSSTPAENKPNEHKKLFGQPSKRTKKGRYGSIFKKN